MFVRKSSIKIYLGSSFTFDNNESNITYHHLVLAPLKTYQVEIKVIFYILDNVAVRSSEISEKDHN